jgi:hypothetical protein
MTLPIREYLATIVNDINAENWYKPGLFIKNTLAKLPIEITILENPPREEDNYNCFIYALGLSTNKEVIRETKGFIYCSFFQKLIEKNELSITTKPEKGDIIVYRNIKQFGDEITHVGIFQDDNTIVSKWSWGPIIKHKIFDVPDFYGSDILFVKKVSTEKARELYHQYKKFNINNQIN